MCRDLPVIITLSCSISLKISATRTSHSYANIADNKIKMHTKCSHNIKFVLEWFCSCFKSWYIILVMRCGWLTGSICFGRANNVSLGFNNRRNHIQINCVFLSYLFRLIDKSFSLSAPEGCHKIVDSFRGKWLAGRIFWSTLWSIWCCSRMSGTCLQDSDLEVRSLGGGKLLQVVLTWGFRPMQVRWGS